MDKPHEQSEAGCCLGFNPDPWDEKEVNLEDKLFIKDRVRTFLHIPLGFGRMIIRNMERIEEAGALAPEALMLCDATSLWQTDVYIAVSKEVPRAETAKVPGPFLTKVFEGPFKDAGKWVREMKDYVKSKGKESKKMYL